MRRTGGRLGAAFALGRAGLVALLAVAPAASAEAVREPAETAGEREPRPRFELAERLRLPQGHVLRSEATVINGWIAAGTHPTASGRDLFLLRARQFDGVLETEHIAPPHTDDVLRLQPAVLSFDGELRGMVWLEGADRRSLAVKGARFKDGQWSGLRTLAAPDYGSQLALSATVLADGSWMAVWSRFDGQDDEIYYTRLTQDGWSRPQRIAHDNRVPDITPSLRAVGNGAIATWSRYDGNDYRVVVARYRNGLWNPPREIGEASSLSPELVQRAEETFVLYRTAVPPTWSVVELGDDARVRRRASVASQARERPDLLADDEGIVLRLRQGATSEETAAAWGERP